MYHNVNYDHQFIQGFLFIVGIGDCNGCRPSWKSFVNLYLDIIAEVVVVVTVGKIKDRNMGIAITFFFRIP